MFKDDQNNSSISNKIVSCVEEIRVNVIEFQSWSVFIWQSFFHNRRVFVDVKKINDKKISFTTYRIKGQPSPGVEEDKHDEDSKNHCKKYNQAVQAFTTKLIIFPLTWQYI